MTYIGGERNGAEDRPGGGAFNHTTYIPNVSYEFYDTK